MKEDFFKVGYTTYLHKCKKTKWTSKIIDLIYRHKFLIATSTIIISCLIMNFWLIYKFIKILEMNPIL